MNAIAALLVLAFADPAPTVVGDLSDVHEVIREVPRTRLSLPHRSVFSASGRSNERLLNIIGELAA